MFKKARIYLIICLLALFQYGNTFEHDYAWDDAIVITENDRVQQGLSDPLEFFRNIKSDDAQHRYGYRPISLLSFAADVEISGMTPKTGHVMNVLYYAILCCLIFYFLRRMFPEKNALFAMIITCLFIVLPVHTEVVANIKSRDEILTMIFGVLSMISFISFLEKEKHKWFYAFLTILTLVASFLSKENGITFMGILLIIAFFKKTERIKPYLIYVLPILGGLAIFAIRSYVYSDAFFENRATELLESSQYREDGFIGNPLFDAKGYKQILPNVFSILLKDLGLLVFPITLVHDYSFSYSTIVSLSNPVVIISIILHLGLIYVVYREFKKKSILLFGILFYFITLFIYLHIFQIGPDYMAERYLFIPSLGFLIVVVSLIERISKGSFNTGATPIWKNPRAKWLLGLVAVFFVFGFAKSINRNKAWENNETLFETDINVLKMSARVNYNYACLLHANYYNAPSELKQEKILYHYKRAVEISDRSMKPMLDLGSAYMEFGNFKKGKETFLKTIDSHPRLAPPLLQLGKYYLSQNNFELALDSYKKAKAISETSEINYSIAYCLMKLNKTDEAIEILVQGEKQATNDYKYFELLSMLRIFKKEYNLALKATEKALKISPNNESLLKNRDWILDSLITQK